MINGILSVVVIFLIFSVGFFFTRRRIWPDNSSAVLSTIVVKIAAPCLAVTSLSSRLTPELMRESLPLIGIAVLHMAALYGFGKLISRLLGLKSKRRTVFEVTFTFSNTIFIGLPINEIVFGQEGAPFLFAYYLISLAGFWTVGATEIAHASDSGGGFSAKKLLSPGLIGVLIGAAVVELRFTIPSALNTALSYLAAICVPLSLLVIGSSLSAFAKNFRRPGFDEVVVMAGKFLLGPLIMFSFLKIFGISGLPFRVFMLTSIMPCHMQTSINAQLYDVEGAYAARLVALSTLICLITTPVGVALLRP